MTFATSSSDHCFTSSRINEKFLPATSDKTSKFSVHDIDNAQAFRCLRRTDSGRQDMGNEVCMVLVELAETTDDPYVRLRDIGVKLRYVRYQVDELPGQAMLADRSQVYEQT